MFLLLTARRNFASRGIHEAGPFVLGRAGLQVRAVRPCGRRLDGAQDSPAQRGDPRLLQLRQPLPIHSRVSPEPQPADRWVCHQPGRRPDRRHGCQGALPQVCAVLACRRRSPRRTRQVLPDPAASEPGSPTRSRRSTPRPASPTAVGGPVVRALAPVHERPAQGDVLADPGRLARREHGRAHVPQIQRFSSGTLRRPRVAGNPQASKHAPSVHCRTSPRDAEGWRDSLRRCDYRRDDQSHEARPTVRRSSRTH